VTELSNISEHAGALARLYGANPMIRAVNFHNTPRIRADQFRRELEHYSRRFSPVNQDELSEYLTTRRWNKSKPGLIIAVYEGFRNNYDVLAPLLEEFGFVGWFFIITGFLDCPVKDQLGFAEGHRIRMNTREYADGRYAMTWDELREIDRKHVIASHTRTHPQLSELPFAEIEREVVGAQEDLFGQLGRTVRAFSSRTGPAFGEVPEIDRCVEAAGYDLIFSNFRIQKLGSANGKMPV
jgi:hypothetical protein